MNSNLERLGFWITPTFGWKIPWDAERSEPGLLFVEMYVHENKGLGSCMLSSMQGHAWAVNGAQVV